MMRIIFMPVMPIVIITVPAFIVLSMIIVTMKTISGNGS